MTNENQLSTDIHNAIESKANNNAEPYGLSDAISAVAEHGSKVVLPICQYSDILYPDALLKIITMQRQGKINIYGQMFDDLCEYIMVKWIKSNHSDKHEYIRKLVKAMKLQDCTNELIVRLQAEATKPRDGVINVKLHSELNRAYIATSVVSAKTQHKIKEFLSHYKIGLSNIDDIDAKMKSAIRTCNLEQTVLSWLGCIIIKSILESRTDIKAADVSKALIEDYSSTT